MVIRILLVFVALFLIIQLFRPAKNIHPGVQPNSIARYGVPHDVNVILEKACNDCHTNNTKYPWYNKIQPVTWFLNNHVTNGKKEFNLDEFGTYSIKKGKHKLKELVDMVKEDKMPLSSYLWIHKEARLSAVEKNTLITWAQNLQDSLQ
ncbi:MAG: heme-binding domain-containing protein [Chitinophagaceae bacterium]